MTDRDKKQYIFDILRRKYVVLTPEEWVRQHFIHYLIEHKGYPQGLMGNEIELHIGDAEKLVGDLPYTFDLAFIDGDKRQYHAYYQTVLPKIKTGGYIIVNNTLWYDKVTIDSNSKDPYTQGVISLNDMVQNDSRVENVLIPIRDGLTLIHKVK